LSRLHEVKEFEKTATTSVAGSSSSGVIGVIAGMVVLAWPFDFIVVLAIVTNAWLAVMGIARSSQPCKSARRLGR
jgi:uncharacterized membrane protein HdeD (DUF308 family)